MSPWVSAAALAAAALPAAAQEARTEVKAEETAPAPEIAPADLTAYARARAADALGAADTAAAGYAIALADVPDDPGVALRAYRQGLAAGDYALATRGMDVLVKADVAPMDTAILAFANAIKARDQRGAEAALARMRKGPLDFMAPVLDAWLRHDRGEDALAALDVKGGSSLARRYASAHRALLLLASKRTAEGLVELRPLLGIVRSDEQDLRIDAVLVLNAVGERRAADKLFGGTRSEVASLRRQAKRTRINAAFGAARLFLSLAADLQQEETVPLSILLTRAALLLDPADDRARLYLADALSRAGSDRLALDMLGEVAKDSPYAREAAAGRVTALSRAGRTTEALASARALANSRNGSSSEAQAYADLLATAGQDDAAAAAYALAIARAGGDGGWALHFLMGKALDRAGRWPEAQTALRTAIELAPRQVAVLTYLGSAQLARREKLDEAQKLLERASRLRPEDVDVTDALGWAHYLRGDPARALPLLERAAKADPAGSRVNEHLGDVYWHLGRRYEARYAWRAAEIYADAGAAARLQMKLANGPTLN